MVFEWDEKKNTFLKTNRGISFERLVVAIEQGDIITILENPNQEKYKDQNLYVLNIDGYAWIMPFRIFAKKRFLITAYPSRRYTRKYLKEIGKDEIL